MGRIQKHSSRCLPPSSHSRARMNVRIKKSSDKISNMCASKRGTQQIKILSKHGVNFKKLVDYLRSKATDVQVVNANEARGIIFVRSSKPDKYRF
jgi:hypothetical protein